MSSEAVERAMEADSDNITNGNISSGEAANLVDALQDEVIRLRSELALALAVVEVARRFRPDPNVIQIERRERDLDAAFSAFDAGRKP